MKFYETHFEDYCKSVEKYHGHSDIVHSLDASENIIVYGSSGVGKYSQVLSMLKPYSPSQLKHDKKIKASTDKQSYTYRISDIHYEVDMSLLGCNSKIIWHEIYSQIVDIITIKPDKIGFIVCKNFHAIHNELLDIFYSYMQKHCYGYDGKSREIQIRFILITEHVSFLPNDILNHCRIIGIGRPSKTYMIEYANSNKSKKVDHILQDIDGKDIMNMKEIYSFSLIENTSELPNDHFNTVCDIIIQEMVVLCSGSSLRTDPSDSYVPCGIQERSGRTLFGKISNNIPENDVGVCRNIAHFRDCLYDILIYNLDGTECIWYIFQHFVSNRYICDKTKMDKFLCKLSVILKQYGNNYRSIFHLENAIFSMMEAFEPIVETI